MQVHGVLECVHAGVCGSVCMELGDASVCADWCGGVWECVHAVVRGAGVCSCRGQRSLSDGVFNYFYSLETESLVGPEDYPWDWLACGLPGIHLVLCP
ncbi:hypothetical protein LEMLEM_LOCUS16753, partial [Lemmus lemmus]